LKTTIAEGRDSEQPGDTGDLFAQIGPQEWAVFADTDYSDLLQRVQGMKFGDTKYPAQAIEKSQDLPIRIIASGHGQLLRDRTTPPIRQKAG
jgi:flavorubredoxin